MREAILVATGAAALKATQLGGWSGTPDRGTVAQFLRAQGVVLGENVG